MGNSNVRTNTKIKIDIKGIKGVKKALQAKMYTKVGIFGKKKSTRIQEKTVEESAATGGQITNAELGVIHEFGSKKNNIPPRSFLNMPIKSKMKEIQKEVSKNKKNIESDLKSGKSESFYNSLGAAALKIINEAFKTGGFGKWMPIFPATIKRKKSSKPLIDTGQLRRSIDFEVKKSG